MKSRTTKEPKAAMIYRKVKGVSVPALGFGTYHLHGEEGINAMLTAMEIGYRHLDTASRYENEAEVGEALARSGLARQEIFLATKLRYTELDPAEIPRRTQESLERLKVDYVDLLMPHWPSLNIPVDEVMSAFAEVRDRGYTRHIGVSNFPAAELRTAIEVLGGNIFANQVEYHPFLDQSAILSVMRPHGIALTAAVPLARGAVTEEPVLKAIGAAHGKTSAQVALRWLMQQERVLAIPKAKGAGRIRENFDIFDFELSDREMAQIHALQGNRRLIDPHWAPVWDRAA